MRYFLILLLSLLTACGAAVPTVKPFKMDIQQGNVVTSKMLLQLRPGMTKSQVKFIMGSPLLLDSFHTSRWDYFYQMRQAGKITEQRRVILEFEKELLSKVRGDVVPQGSPEAATAADTNTQKSVLVEPKPKQETGLLDKLKFWKSDEAEAAQKEAAKAKDSMDKESLNNKTAPEASIDVPAGDVPSVLAVPIGIEPSLPVPELNLPSATPEPAIKTERIEAEPALTPSPEPVVITPIAEAAPPAPVPVEAKPAEAKPVETKLVETKLVETKPALPVEVNKAVLPKLKEDTRLIFRMDRNLNLKNLEAAPAPAILQPSAVEIKPEMKQNLQPRSKNVQLPPDEIESSNFLERMFEKIGF